MISSYTDLISAIQNWLDRSDLSSHIPSLLDMAQLRIERDIKGWENEKVGYLGIPSAARRVPLPSDCVRINQISQGWYSGDDCVTNGEFESASGWTVGAGWEITGGEAQKSSDGTGTLSQDIASSITAGKVYAVSFTVTSNTAGSVTVTVGGATSPAISGLGDKIVVLEAEEESGLVFTPTDTDTRINLDDVKVREVEFYTYASRPWMGQFNIVGGELLKTEYNQIDQILRLVYTAKPSRLSATVSTNALFAAHPDLYLFAALSEAAPFLFEDGRIAIWETKYQEIKRLINAQATSDSVEVPKLKERNPYLI